MWQFILGIIIGGGVCLLVFARVLEKYENEKNEEFERLKNDLVNKATDLEKQLSTAIDSYTVWTQRVIKLWLQLYYKDEQEAVNCQEGNKIA